MTPFTLDEPVYHDRFGDGVVRSSTGHNVEVEFPGLGITKTILSAFLSRRALKALGRAPDGKPVELNTVCGAELHARPIPVREFHVPGLIPARTVTMIGGDGGVGKSLLAKQLACSTALGCEWIGHQVEPGRALYLSAEDDLDEVHRRLADIVRGYGCELRDLSDLRIAPLAGEDAVLAAPAGRTNILTATPLWQALETMVADFRPRLVVLDTLADLFGGQENERIQARQFIGLLRGLAIKQDTTIVLLAHPSQSGMASGSGTSGSTSWNNSVRSRLYLERALLADERGRMAIEADPDLRILSTKKANYANVGGQFRVRWREGMFWPEDAGPSTAFDKASSALQADYTFMSLLADYTQQGRHVSATPSANFAPSVFAKDPASRGLSKAVLAAAMNRLFTLNRITVEEFGPLSRRLKRIVQTPSEGGDDD
ncbi:AAA family ATPase [Methylobacterium sp. J-090]|uniref:AAA family ATPase n=1 Tax=Methylobacterium sp. J-090 TaxID=2836666 RepID=UPI001FB9FD3B|nr:AAA family ATPase [Methylobacterium sp. J-090]MCJ2082768.1 AAA family ATPase [Methylobacterium sp. J-090]